MKWNADIVNVALSNTLNIDIWKDPRPAIGLPIFRLLQFSEETAKTHDSGSFFHFNVNLERMDTAFYGHSF